MTDEPAPFVRPYMLTRGRTRSQGPQLRIETLVRTAMDTAAAPDRRSPEEHRIISLCRDRACSVAEVAALVPVPLGVARVLIGDLAHRGWLEVAETDDTPDITLIREVLHGLLVDQ